MEDELIAACTEWYCHRGNLTCHLLWKEIGDDLLFFMHQNPDLIMKWFKTNYPHRDAFNNPPKILAQIAEEVAVRNLAEHKRLEKEKEDTVYVPNPKYGRF